jgi:hypothetical protein
VLPLGTMGAWRRFPDGTTAIRAATPSEDGSLFAYGLSSGGSDWTVIKVRDVASGAILPGVARCHRGSAALSAPWGVGGCVRRTEEGPHTGVWVGCVSAVWLLATSADRGESVSWVLTCADNVPWVKFSGISWTHDNKGFFYSVRLLHRPPRVHRRTPPPFPLLYPHTPPPVIFRRPANGHARTNRTTWLRRFPV